MFCAKINNLLDFVMNMVKTEGEKNYILQQYKQLNSAILRAAGDK